jgi:hypothetical protein
VRRGAAAPGVTHSKRASSAQRRRAWGRRRTRPRGCGRSAPRAAAARKRGAHVEKQGKGKSPSVQKGGRLKGGVKHRAAVRKAWASRGSGPKGRSMTGRRVPGRVRAPTAARGAPPEYLSGPLAAAGPARMHRAWLCRGRARCQARLSGVWDPNTDASGQSVVRTGRDGSGEGAGGRLREERQGQWASFAALSHPKFSGGSVQGCAASEPAPRRYGSRLGARAGTRQGMGSACAPVAALRGPFRKGLCAHARPPLRRWWHLGRERNRGHKQARASPACASAGSRQFGMRERTWCKGGVLCGFLRWRSGARRRRQCSGRLGTNQGKGEGGRS